MSGKDFWGPKVWETIHILAITYTPEKKQAFKQFINDLTVLLPCDECRLHLKSNLKKIPLDHYLTNNRQLFLWSYLLHDLVNQQLNKQSIPFEDAKKMYTNGDDVWDILYIFAITYTPSKRTEFKQFVDNLIILLPRKDHRLHLKANLKKLPVDDYLNNNHQLFLWSYKMRDLIEQQFGIRAPPYEEIKLHYIKKLGAECQACKVK